MVTKFKEIEVQQIKDNGFKLIGKDWMLITAGAKNSFNTMTASWGGFGVIWRRNICWCVIRPVRYTYKFTEKNVLFTLSFFGEKYRKVLNYCGGHSGNKVDKIKATGLTPVTDIKDAIYFKEARLVMVCKKIYFQDITPKNFVDKSIDKNYPNKDYHRMYFGEVVKCLYK